MKRLAIGLLALAIGFALPAAQGAEPLFPKVRVQTSEGSFVLRLNRERAPLTVENFLGYVRSGHYEGTVFHRVIKGFMAQGGGFTADLEEKPTDGSVVNESGNGLRNARATIAMARTANPHSATAQFYINLVDNEALDPNERRWGYCVFGDVVEGMDVVDKIAELPTGPKARFRKDVPLTTVVIEKIEILGAGP